MRIYRVAWLVSAIGATTFTVVHDLASGGWVRLLVLGPVMALVGGILGFVFAEDRPDRRTWAMRGAIWTGLGTMAADAFVSTWGGLGMLVGLALLLTSPVLLRTARGRFLAWSARRTTGPPESLATRDLLRRWDWTTMEVRRDSTSTARRLALVEERRTLLDELQSRDPSHFDHWMATGP